MKKKLVASLAAAMVIGIAGTAFASNPFVEVPANHWAYASVTKLAQDGIIDGYGDGTFRGDKTMTRYEMAQIVAKAMAKSDKADASQKAVIDKLAVEFSRELDALDVRVDKVEKKVDNVKWGGEVRVRYDSAKQDNLSRDTSPSQSYADMWATAQINPDWIGKVEYESSKKLTNGKTRAGSDGEEENTTRIFAQGPLFGVKTTVGKFNPFVGYGLVIDDSMTGLQLEFGNQVKARVGYGKYAGDLKGSALAGGVADTVFTDSPTYVFGELDYAMSKSTNIKAAYHKLSSINSTDIATQNSIHYTEVGFDTKIAPDWALMATYAKSNLDVPGQDNKGYLTQITYKAADLKKVGSYDIYTNYRKIPSKFSNRFNVGLLSRY